MGWNPLEIPSQHGKTFVVTGGNAGIGYFAAEQLARAGGHIVIASRNPERVAVAQAAIRTQVPEASLGFVRLDLTSLASVKDAVAELAALPALEAVVLNAGVMSLPGKGETTQDGFPLMIGSYLGNFALTVGLLNRAHPARVIHTSSGFVRRVTSDVSDLRARPSNGPVEYTRSKEAIEVFGFELDRRLRAASRPTSSIMTRPGMSVDSRTPVRPGLPRSSRLREPLWGLLGQSKESSAWSAVRAATDPDAVGGQYYGPTGSISGPPVLVEPTARTARPEGDLADRLWQQSEELTGVAWGMRSPSSR